jgi:hypothetical protein
MIPKGIIGKWTAKDLKTLRGQGLSVDMLAWKLEKSPHAIRRILSRPDSFVIDVPPSKDVIYLSIALGKATVRLDLDTLRRIDWAALEYRRAWKAGAWNDFLHRTMEERVARPVPVS